MAAPKPQPKAKPAPKASAPKATTHTVRSGDSLYKLAKKYGVGVDDIRAANSLKNDDIKIGQKIKIPAPKSGKKRR